MTTATPVAAPASQGAMPFTVASRQGVRPAFETPIATLSAVAPTPLNPIIVPAVGHIRSILLEVIVSVTGGTSPAWTADGPFNVIQSINFKTASGNDIIVPVTGYDLMLMNKWGGYYVNGDPRAGRQYTATASGAHFFLRLPFEFDSETGLGSIPALASNRSYTINATLAATPTAISGAPAVTVQIKGFSEFWHEPPAVSTNGYAQATAPIATGTLSQWQKEMTGLTPGDKLTKLNNVGNIQRTVIFTARNASGARIDVNGWPVSPVEIYLDNELMTHLPTSVWENYMSEWFNLNTAAKDAVGGLDTGVYVLPFHALAGSLAGDPANSRAQLLPTLNTASLQIRGSWGSAISTLEILSNTIIPASGSGFHAIFSK